MASDDPYTYSYNLGNGILNSTTGKGVLEHIALTPADGLGVYHVYLDNVQSVPVAGPTGPLSYSLDAAPPGATIDAYTGVINWTPDSATTETFTVRVTDGLGLSSTQTFTVTASLGLTPAMLNPPVYDSATGDVTISGTGAANQNYRLWYTDSLTTPAWVNGGEDTSKTGVFSWQMLGPSPATRFYKVESY